MPAALQSLADSGVVKKQTVAAAMPRWTPMDVYGCLRMAPRAGFEIDRKFLSAHTVQCV